MREFADFACALADAARGVTLPAAMRIGAVDNKIEGQGFDPVTEADRGSEKAMRGLIEYRFPNHGIAGEEFPDRPARGRHVWSLDPIDGTRSFICGLPSWTTLIALLEDGAPVLGLIDAPRLGERYLGFGGTTSLITASGTRPLKVSACRSLAEARFSTTDPYLFKGAEMEAFERLRAKAQLTRFGHDAYAYARLADGTIDLVVESGLQPFDYQALIPVVRGAGGVVGNWEGGEDCSGGRLVAAATRELFDETVATLAG
jgi:myo-inositol-1(or 4)-monophosphatase